MDSHYLAQFYDGLSDILDVRSTAWHCWCLRLVVVVAKSGAMSNCMNAASSDLHTSSVLLCGTSANRMSVPHDGGDVSPDKMSEYDIGNAREILTTLCSAFSSGVLAPVVGTLLLYPQFMRCIFAGRAAHCTSTCCVLHSSSPFVKYLTWYTCGPTVACACGCCACR